MSRTRHPQVKSPLRFCLSCCVTLGCWALWLVLGAALAVQIYIVAAKDMPVPPFILRRIESELAAQNLAIRFGGAHFDPNGHLLLENVELRSLTFEEPLLTSRLIYLQKSPWSVLAGRPVPDQVRLEGAMLQLPAMLSPSGTAQPLFRDLAATLRFDHHLASVDQLAFRLDDVRITAHGTIMAPRPSGGAAWSLDTVIPQFLQFGRRLADQLPRLKVLDQPALTVEFSARPEGGFDAAWQLTAAALHEPANLPLHVGSARATGSWSSGQPAANPLSITLTAAHLRYADTGDIAQLRGRLVIRPGSSLLAPQAVDLQLATGHVHAMTENTPGVMLRGRYEPGRAFLSFDTTLPLADEPFALHVDANMAERQAHLQLAGRVQPALANRILAERAPKLAPYLVLGDPVDLHARAEFASGWRFAGLWSRVQGGRLDSRGVPVTSTRGRIDVDADGNFLAHDAFVTLGDNHARGSYWMNFRSMNYRMLLSGRLRPPTIAGWFRGDWWPAFWRNFSFPVAAPTADVDVQGNWRDGTRTAYFGYTRVEGASAQGVDFDLLRTRIFVRPQFAHVQIDDGRRAGGTQFAQGWFKRTTDPVTRQLLAMEYDLRGNLDGEAQRKLGGEAATTLLAPWQFTANPEIHFWGRTDYSSGRAVPNLRFAGGTDRPVRYFGFPLDAVSAEGGTSGDSVRIDHVTFRLAGGEGSGKASLTAIGGQRQLGFDLYLKNADLARTIRATEEYEAARTGQPASASNTDSKFMKRASGGRLELAVSAQGNPESLESFQGGGNLRLTGAELAEVQLFGLLSQVLSAVSLNFSSLKLDAAGSSFQLANGRLHFPDVKITGPNSVTDAVGDFRFADKSLDFTAKFRPYEGNRNLLTGVLGLVVNPLSSFFELKLTGPVSNPKWSIVLAPGSLRSTSPSSPSPPPASTPPAEPKH